MPDHEMSVPIQSELSAKTKPSWWTRNRYSMFVLVLAYATTQWAVHQLTWLFGWTAEPRQGHLGQIFDALVILAAGVFLFIHANRQVLRREKARQAMLDRFHEKALKAKAAKSLHA